MAMATAPALQPAGTVGISLPIEYPVGEELPDLGDTPGPLAAIWMVPRGGGGAPEAVGLVAETGTFGTLPINLSHDDPGGPGYMVVALSPDGRRIAYTPSPRELIVRDLVSGEKYSPPSEFKTRDGFTWVDATHLVGHVWGRWRRRRMGVGAGHGAQTGRPILRRVPTRADGGTDPWFLTVDPEDDGTAADACPSDRGGEEPWPVLCDVVGVLSSEVALDARRERGSGCPGRPRRRRPCPA